MENTDFTYTKLSDMSVEMQSQTNRNMVPLAGKAVLNESEKRFTFMQNPPRAKNSVEVGRTNHGRMVRRNDGLYTLTFRMVDMDEKYISESLISEVRNIVKIAKNDNEVQKQKAKEEAKKAQEAQKAQENQESQEPAEAKGPKATLKPKSKKTTKKSTK